jgi:putative oxidoreductase
MKTAVVIARTLLGIIFVVFGLNGFLQFLPQPEMPQAAIAFFGGLAASGFMLPTLFATQLVGGALLLLGMVPLGVVILAPVIVHIVEFHVFLAPAGLPLAVVVAALALFLAWTHRPAYRLLFAASLAPSTLMGTPEQSAPARPRA